MVRLQFRGQVASLLRQEAERIHALVAAEGMRSARSRNLALALDWALSTGQTVVLRRAEVRELQRLAACYEQLATLLGQLAPHAVKAA
jgi:hypothetical protein